MCPGAVFVEVPVHSTCRLAGKCGCPTGAATLLPAAQVLSTADELKGQRQPLVPDYLVGVIASQQCHVGARVHMRLLTTQKPPGRGRAAPSAGLENGAWLTASCRPSGGSPTPHFRAGAGWPELS